MPESQDRVPTDDAILMTREVEADAFGLLGIFGVHGNRKGNEAEFAHVAPSHRLRDITQAKLRVAHGANSVVPGRGLDE
jgi:hypothetical protein